MAVRSADLLAPSGLVELFMFPGETQAKIEERLASSIAEAVEKGSPSDAATRAWAYHRAFTSVYLRLLTNPATVDVPDEGSHSILAAQINRMKELADRYLGEWLVLQEETPSVSVSLPHGPTPTRFTW